MGDILTYIEAYREKSLEIHPFNIVDSLILCQLAYFKYEDSDFSKVYFDKRIGEFYRMHAENPGDIILKGMLTAKGDEKIIPLLAVGNRFAELRACRYVESFSREKELQFAAITFELGNNEYYIAIRGTDTSIVGWKEDFSMSFQEEVPAQKAALEYVYDTMLSIPGKFYVGGHSKGGNLAVYASMKLSENMQSRIKAVYSFDGPGFLQEVYEGSNYKSIQERVYKIIPRTSIVGMILEERAEYKVVQSNRELHMQHDPYSWEVVDEDFVYVDAEDSFARMLKRILDGWLDELDRDERKKIINTVFNVLYDTGITSFYELTEQTLEKIKKIMDGASQVDLEERSRIQMSVKRLLSIAKDELKNAARTERLIQLEKSVVQLEKYAMKVEKIIQSISNGDKTVHSNIHDNKRKNIGD